MEGIKSLGFNPEMPLYHLPLTGRRQTSNTAGVVSIQIETVNQTGRCFSTLQAIKPWTRDNYGPIYVPKKALNW